MFNIAWSVEKLNIQAVNRAGSVGILFNLMVKVFIVSIVLRMVLAIVIASYKDIQKKDSSEVRGIDGDLVMITSLGFRYAQSISHELLDRCVWLVAQRPLVHAAPAPH